MPMLIMKMKIIIQREEKKEDNIPQSVPQPVPEVKVEEKKEEKTEETIVEIKCDENKDENNKNEENKIEEKKEEKKLIDLSKSKLNLSAHYRLSSPQHRDLSKNAEKQQKTLNKSASDFEEKQKKKCFDNKGAILLEPRNRILTVGQEYRFKIKINNCKHIVVLDGRRWNYLKRIDNGIYEGSVRIKNEQIVLCGMRENNMYTEIFEFLAIKRS